MNKKHFMHFLIIAAVLLVGSSVTFAEDITLQFTSWMVAEESGGEEWLPERIAEWEKMHPGVKVEIIPLGWEDTPDKITMQVQAKNAPDVFTIESLWLGKFGEMPNAVEDLSKYMDAGFTSQLVPAYKGGEIDGKMAGLVWNPNPWVLVYNKELVEKAGVSGQPEDFDDFLKQARAVSELGPDIYGFGMQLGVDEYAADTFHIIMWPLGGDFLDESGQPAVNSPGTVEAVKLVQDGVDNSGFPLVKRSEIFEPCLPRVRLDSFLKAHGLRVYWTARGCRGMHGMLPHGRDKCSPPHIYFACLNTQNTKIWHGIS